MKRNGTNLRLSGRIAAFLLMLVPVLALGASLELNTQAFEEVDVVKADGKKEKKTQPLSHAVPGKEVIYTTTYRNKGDKPADKVVINNALPQGLAYKAGSAQGTGTKVEVSVDGGKQYGVLQMLSVKGKDGKARPATAEDVTHVRWTLSTPVKAGGEGKVTYRAIVK